MNFVKIKNGAGFRLINLANVVDVQYCAARDFEDDDGSIKKAISWMNLYTDPMNLESVIVLRGEQADAVFDYLNKISAS